MSVSNGQIANATTFNNAFLSKTDTSAANTTIGIIGLNNTSDVNSGSQVFNTQRLINEIRDTVGISAEGDASRKVYTSNNVVADGDDLNVAVGKIDAKFDQSTGHAHDNTPGAGGPVSASDLSDFNNYIADWQTFSITGAAGTDDDVSTQLTGETPGGGVSTEGVITSPPYNKVELRESTTDTYVEDAGGQRVYGRITEAVGVWTISYYTNEAGVETAHTLASQDVKVYFLKVFTMANRPTIPVDAGFIASLDLTADIVDASLTSRGAVSVGAQSFAGLKTLGDGVKIEDEISTPQTTQASGGALTALAYKPLVVVTGASTTTLQGIASGGDGKWIVIHNDSTGDLTIEHESASATAADRIFLPEATDITVGSQSSIEFFYDSGDSRWKQKSGSGSGTGSGSGGDLFKNYITNGNANSITGWSTYADAAGSEPVDGTGGTATGVTFSVNTSSPIDGTKDFKLSKDAADRQGKGVSYDFTTGTVTENQRFKIAYMYTASTDFTAGSNSDVRMFLYDITNSRIIRPARKELIVGSGIYESVWDTSSSTSYRLIFHIATTNALAWDLQFKFVSTGVGRILTGPNVEDMIADPNFTINNFGTITDYNIWRSIVADRLMVGHSSFTLGTPAAAIGSIQLPSGMKIDSSKFSSSSDIQVVGTWYIHAANVYGTGAYFGPLFYDGSDEDKIFYGNQSSGNAIVKLNGNGIGSAGNVFSLEFNVPIKGRSANQAIAGAGVIRMSDILANGTRVTSDPTALGEYRSRSKDTGVSNTFSDQAPTTPPTIADGIRLHGADYTSAQTSGEISLYDIFIGKNKSWKFVLYDSAGRIQSTQMYYDYKIVNSTVASGINLDYDESAGILRVNVGTNDLATNTNRNISTADSSGGTNDGYFDVYVADNDYQIQLAQNRNEVQVRVATGFGSVGDHTRTYSTLHKLFGDKIVYTPDATNGDYFTVYESNFYTITAIDGRAGALSEFGVTVNSSDTTVSFSALSADEVVVFTETDMASTGGAACCSARVWLDYGDVLRIQGANTLNVTTYAKVIITKG